MTYAVEPCNVYAPVSGIVTSVFPTKHAVGILSDKGVEVLVHVGLDTVALNGAPFSAKVTDGQRVEAGDLLLVADLMPFAQQDVKQPSSLPSQTQLKSNLSALKILDRSVKIAKLLK